MNPFLGLCLASATLLVACVPVASADDTCLSELPICYDGEPCAWEPDGETQGGIGLPKPYLLTESGKVGVSFWVPDGTGKGTYHFSGFCGTITVG